MKIPALGFGLGLRPTHYETILSTKPKTIDWFEIISEDYMIDGGTPLHYLDQIREHYPIVMHGVGMSVGSADPLNKDYLNKLKRLIDRIDPPWVSDHLCWTGVKGANMHDLLPLPYTEETLAHVINRLKEAQDYLGRQLLLENPSSYVSFAASTITEWDFMNRIAEGADCLILLDVNNIYVSSFNHGFDPYEYLDAINPERVQQFHLAGHLNCKTHIIDTHDADVIDPVWKMYKHAVKRFGNVSTMIERDDKIPALEDLIKELQIAKDISAEVLGKEKVAA